MTRRRANSTRNVSEAEAEVESACEDGVGGVDDGAVSGGDGDEENSVCTGSAGGRSSRKRQLPARFRDVDLEIQPSRRRRVSSSVQDTTANTKKQQLPASEPFDEFKLPDRSPSPLPLSDVVDLKEEVVDLKSSDVQVMASTVDSELVAEVVAEPDPAHQSLTEPVETALVPSDHHFQQEQQQQQEVEERFDPSAQQTEHVVSLQPGEQDLVLPGHQSVVTSAAVAEWPATSMSYVCGGEGQSADPLAAAAGAFFASDDELDGRDAAALSSVPSAALDDDDDLIAMEVESLEVPLPSNEEPREACKVCHRQMKVSQLRQHMLLHAGLRPYKCEVCRAAFTRRSDVFRHVKIVHHQEKPFKCSLDGKEFSDRKSLKQHMEQHKRPVLFACKVCDFRFGKFDSYVNHIKNIHPTGEPIPSFPEEVEPAPEPLAPPRGRHGPKPLEDFVEEDMMSMPSGSYLEPMSAGERLQMGSGLESIETEEIPHDSMQLVASEDHPAVAAVQQATANGSLLSHDSAHSSVGIGKAGDPQSAHMELPVLDEDTAALLGMPDLSLPVSAAEPAPLSAPDPAPRSYGSRVQPRVVTIGKPGGAGDSAAVPGQFKTVLLTRPRMVAGRQVLQAVKLSPGQRIVAARVPPTATAARVPHVIRSSTGRPRVLAPAVAPVAAPPPPESEPSRNIEVTTSSPEGASRTIVLQTGGEPGTEMDILQSKEAMQSLLSAVQQMVAASGDTLEGKQIEIVMQNDQAK